MIAAITCCTNTSNPCVLIAAGLLARKAVAKGLTSKPWVKTSLAPGSQVVTEYLDKAGLQKRPRQARLQSGRLRLHHLHRQLRPAAGRISDAINENGLVAAAVLSGNRNFEGRVNPDVRANYLASPPLVVAYALAGTMQMDLTSEPLGTGKRRQAGLPEGHLADLARRSRRSSREHHARAVPRPLRRRVQGRRQLARHRVGGRRDLRVGRRGPPTCGTRPTSRASTKRPKPITDIKGARILGVVRRQDHHRPHLARRFDQGGVARRRIPAASTACAVADFNQYGTRRGNHEVMMRGTFANIRIKNFMVRDAAGNVKEGGLTVHYPAGEADVDLRRRHALQGRGRAARRVRGQANTATARRATGRRRAPSCSACAP